MIDLKHKCKVYDRRVQQALIPFYIQRIEYLNDQIEESESDAVNGKQTSLLRKLKEELQSEQAAEEKDIKDMANEIYQIWKDIKIEREVKVGSSPAIQYTSQKLVVHKG